MPLLHKAMVTETSFFLLNKVAFYRLAYNLMSAYKVGGGCAYFAADMIFTFM